MFVLWICQKARTSAVSGVGLCTYSTGQYLPTVKLHVRLGRRESVRSKVRYSAYSYEYSTYAALYSTSREKDLPVGYVCMYVCMYVSMYVIQYDTS